MSRRDDASSGNDARTAILFAGPGATRAALRAADWAATPLGDPERWPLDLRRCAHTVVRSAAPMVVWWGEQFVQIPNDAVIESLGGDALALARPAKECWPDQWQVLGPLAEEAFGSGDVLHRDDVVLPGDDDRTRYWTVTLSPLHEDRHVAGVLMNAVDLTARVTAEEFERRSADAATANLRLALESNRRIGTAIGILMAQRRITDDAAFELLRSASQRGHRKLRDIAEDVVLTGALPD